MKNWILAGALLVAFNGNSFAGLEEGRAAARAGDFKRAIQEALPDAQRGDPEAQSLLGTIYDHELEQFGEAMKWYRKASDQGHSRASEAIGLMYFVGLGVKQDYTQAIQWDRKAVSQGARNGPLFRSMGLFYAEGHGVQQNLPIGYALTQFSYKFDTNPKYDNGIESKMNRQQLAEGKKLLEQLSSSNDILATLDSYAGAQQASNPAPAAPNNSRVTLQSGQAWAGQYRCAQGLTPFTVQFTGVTPTTDSERYQIDGTFSFGGQGLPSGSYGLSGVYFVSQGNIQLEPTRWIQRPLGYMAVGLRGSLKPGTNVLTGKINHPSCSEFQLALSNQARGVQPQSEPSNRTTASDSTPKSLIDYLPPAREPEDQTQRICRGDVDARITDRSYEGKLFSSGAMEIVGDWARKYYAPGRTRQDCPKINPVNALIYWKYAIGASNLSGTWTNEDVDRFIAERQKAELAMRADQPSRLQPGVSGNALLPRDSRLPAGIVATPRATGNDWSMSRIVAAIRAAAERGDPEGQYKYADFLEYGTGIPKDSQQSLSWIKKAAEQGYAPAQSSLGVTYYYGYKGIEKNHSEALMWFSKGAQGGDDSAQYKYGVMLAEGDNVKKDLRKAIYWWEKAAAQGHDLAVSSLEKLRAEGKGALLTPGAITGDLELLQKRAQQGDPEAQKKLGDKFRRGKGVPKDLDGGTAWFRKALPAYISKAEQGDAEYQYEVGNMLWAINRGPDMECFRWYVKAANQGHVKAISILTQAPWIP